MKNSRMYKISVLFTLFGASCGIFAFFGYETIMWPLSSMAWAIAYFFKPEIRNKDEAFSLHRWRLIRYYKGIGIGDCDWFIHQRTGKRCILLITKDGLKIKRERWKQ